MKEMVVLVYCMGGNHGNISFHFGNSKNRAKNYKRIRHFEAMGSVKDLVIIKEAKENEAGIAQFVFSDRYSVFDWGEMPNHIKDKGKALCIIGAYFFEKLEERGIKTHYIGLVENGKVKRLDELNEAVNVMQFKLLRVLKPQLKNGNYDYSIYKKEKSNFLIPLEIIYRNALPAGSSVFRRLKEGSISLDDLGLSRMPQPGEKLEKPILDVSTKLEEIDRYISWNEAKEIAGLNEEEAEEMKNLTMEANKLISKEISKAGLENEDGKVEFGFDEKRQIIFVDVLGTPDECRFKIDNVPVSKEIARIFYRKTEWYEKIEEAKKRDKLNWKKYVSSPPPLPTKLEKLLSWLYQACCNEITGREWFDVPKLKEIIGEIKEFL